MASYDGSSMALFLDGARVAASPACASPPCGAILYPAAAVGHCSARTPMTIGTYVDRFTPNLIFLITLKPRVE